MNTEDERSRTIQVQDLDLSLDEAKDLLIALRTGEIDAVLISKPGGEQVYTLQSADRPYRLMIESMSEGAVTFSQDGTILYCNRSFAKLVGSGTSEVIGKKISEFIVQEYIEAFHRMIDSESSEGRMELMLNGKIATTPVQLSLWTIRESDLINHCAVFTDLTVHYQRTELTKRYEVEEALRKEAEESNRKKDRFLAMLAHELRGPLAPIRNSVKILRDVEAADFKHAWARNVIDNQVDHLARLADDLLDVARITEGKVTLHHEHVELQSVFKHAIETSSPLIESKQHQLHVAIQHHPILIEGDSTRLSQTVSNLLVNAAKFTKPGGDIWLSAELKENEVEIRVRDEGDGIAPEILPHIFDLFVQADDSLDRSESGLGIGLTLVRSLVEMHGGIVTASSEGPGKGSEFVVRLPVLPDLKQSKEESRSNQISMGSSSQFRILVVDDSTVTALSMAMVLELHGHEVKTAHDAQSTMNICQNFIPDVILLDIGLPGIDGYKVAQTLRENAKTCNAVLIAISGYGRAQDIARSKQAGFNLHLVKPVNPDQLQSLILSHVTDRG